MANPVLYGYKILNSTSSTSQTLDLTTLLDPSGAALGPALAGQFTAIHIFVASNADRTPAATGYTVVMDAWANDTNDMMLWAGYKFQPGTPDTSITITGATSGTSRLVAIATVWDNVDPTTPMDVSAVNNSPLNTAIPNPGSATPATTGAVFLFGAGNASDQGVTTLSESYMDWSVGDSGNGSFDVAALVGYVSGGVASTPYDGAALTWSGTDSTAYSNATNVMVLRPTSGGGSQTITGALYSDTDSFGAGTVSTAYTITGAVYADADSFGAGAFIFDQTLIGATYTDTDAFGAGTFSQAGGSQTITGAIYADADSFGAGAFSAAYTVTGAAYSDPDAFGAGTFAAAYTITGAAYVNPDTFGAGAFIFDQTLTGAVYVDADTFGAGIFSLAGGSLQTITGATYTDSDIFGAGAFSSAYTITGATYANPDAFGSGAFSAAYTIAGALYANPDSFGAGSFAIAGVFPIDSGTGIWPGYRFATALAPATRKASPAITHRSAGKPQ